MGFMLNTLSAEYDAPPDKGLFNNVQNTRMDGYEL